MTISKTLVDHQCVRGIGEQSKTTVTAVIRWKKIKIPQTNKSRPILYNIHIKWHISVYRIAKTRLYIYTHIDRAGISPLRAKNNPGTAHFCDKIYGKTKNKISIHPRMLRLLQVVSAVKYRRIISSQLIAVDKCLNTLTA